MLLNHEQRSRFREHHDVSVWLDAGILDVQITIFPFSPILNDGDMEGPWVEVR